MAIQRACVQMQAISFSPAFHLLPHPVSGHVVHMCGGRSSAARTSGCSSGSSSSSSDRSSGTSIPFSGNRAAHMRCAPAPHASMLTQRTLAGGAMRVASTAHDASPDTLDTVEHTAISTGTSTTQASVPETSQQSPNRVNLTYRGVCVEGRRGAKLRTALLRGGLTPHNGDARLINCRGLGTCGTCAVEIRGPVSPSTWTTAETLRLNFPPHGAPGNQRLRLACQVRCEGDLDITKYDKFWGEGSTPLGPLSAAAQSASTAGLSQNLQSSGTAPAARPAAGAATRAAAPPSGASASGTSSAAPSQQGPVAGSTTGSTPSVTGSTPAVTGSTVAPEPVSRLGVGLMPLGALEFLLDRDADQE